MFSILAAAAIGTACMGGPGADCAYTDCAPASTGNWYNNGYQEFSPDHHNGLLATYPPEDFSRVYTPGYSEYSGRLWVGDDVKDIRSRRAYRENPGNIAYGAAGAECERVWVQVGHIAVPISPWAHVEGETRKNFERARQEWLAERGYTGGVRTFVNPARLRAAAQPQVVAETAEPQPSATIRLRNPDQKGGRIRGVDAGVAGGVKILAGEQPVRISWPMQARAEVVERAVARGWTESEKAETEVAAAQR